MTNTTHTAAREYPRPDRSDFIPNFARTAENDSLDIGWGEGTLSDGRPYRIEAWACDGVTAITVFFSRIGLDALTNDTCGTLLEREGLLRFEGPERSVELRPLADASKQPIWSATAVIGDSDALYARSDVPLQPYPGRPKPAAE